MTQTPCAAAWDQEPPPKERVFLGEEKVLPSVALSQAPWRAGPVSRGRPQAHTGVGSRCSGSHS